MESEPADGATEGTAFRYYRWRETVIRHRSIRDVEALTTKGWTYSPYALDALTGMGEDPYSCGEWADEVSEAEAAEIAGERGLSLTGERMDPPDHLQKPPKCAGPGAHRRWLRGWARRQRQ